VWLRKFHDDLTPRHGVRGIGQLCDKIRETAHVILEHLQKRPCIQGGRRVMEWEYTKINPADLHHASLAVDLHDPRVRSKDRACGGIAESAHHGWRNNCDLGFQMRATCCHLRGMRIAILGWATFQYARDKYPITGHVGDRKTAIENSS
jgi:hypothetical protein